jgi:hypothetical protein
MSDTESSSKGVSGLSYSFYILKKSPNLSFLFSWRIGLINPNRAVMESDNLHAAEEKVKIIKYYCIGASLSASCCAKCLIVISKYIRCSHKKYCVVLMQPCRAVVR